jgi:hypothetical protein
MKKKPASKKSQHKDLKRDAYIAIANSLQLDGRENLLMLQISLLHDKEGTYYVPRRILRKDANQRWSHARWLIIVYP